MTFVAVKTEVTETKQVLVQNEIYQKKVEVVINQVVS